MNINQNINNLLYALKQKEKVYKINSFKFYNENKDKYITRYQVLKREVILKEKYNIAKECYSKIELMKYLADEYKKIGSEADGK